MQPHSEASVDTQVMGLANRYSSVSLMRRAHRHNEVELNFVEKGSMTYLFGGTPLRIEAGQMTLFWASIPHQTIHTEPGSCFHWLTIPFPVFVQWRLPDILQQQVILGKVVHCPATEQSQVLMRQFRQWRADFEKPTEEHRRIVLLEVEASLRRLALAMQEDTVPLIQNSSGNAPLALSKVEQMACFIADHYAEPLRVDDVAVAVHLHPNYAVSVFRKHFGVSMTEYINQYRVAHAQRLLITTDANVSEIALDAGFGSVSRFYSVFKDACGQLPGDYRNGLRLETDTGK